MKHKKSFRQFSPRDNLSLDELFPSNAEQQRIASGQYPYYDNNEREQYKNDPRFYIFDQGDLTNHAIGSRLAMLAAPQSSVLLHESTVKAKALLDYWKELSSVNQIEYITYKNIRNIRRRLQELCNSETSIITPAPYVMINNHDLNYFCDPEIVATVNDKDNLHRFVPDEFLPQRKTGLELDHIQILDEIAANFEYPVVLKGGGGNTGGDAIRISNNNKETETAINRFLRQGCKSLIIEEYFIHDQNFNVQTVASDTETIFLGYSEQLIQGEGIYGGNIFDLDKARDVKNLPESVISSIFTTSENMRKAGYKGVIGLDVLYNSSNLESRVIDPNARINGSTGFLSKLPLMTQGNQRGRTAEFIGAYAAEDLDSIFKKLASEVNRGALYIIGGANSDGESKMYFSLIGDEDERKKSKELLEDKKIRIA